MTRGLSIRMKIWISLFIRLSFFGAAAYATFREEWLSLFIAVLGIVSLSLPSLMQRNYRITLPIEFESTVAIFLYASLLLGEITGFYNRFGWWDLALHTGSSIALGFIGFLILFTLLDQRRLQASPFIIAVFTFSFALAVGGVWEIFEFSMDEFFGLSMQGGSLFDTMSDLVVDAIGGLVASVVGYLYLRERKPRSRFSSWFHFFLERNRRWIRFFVR